MDWGPDVRVFGRPGRGEGLTLSPKGPTGEPERSLCVLSRERDPGGQGEGTQGDGVLACGPGCLSPAQACLAPAARQGCTGHSGHGACRAAGEPRPLPDLLGSWRLQASWRLGCPQPTSVNPNLSPKQAAAALRHGASLPAGSGVCVCLGGVRTPGTLAGGHAPWIPGVSGRSTEHFWGSRLKAELAEGETLITQRRPLDGEPATAF